MRITEFSFVAELFAQNNDNFIQQLEQQLSYFSVTWIPLCETWHLSGPVLTGRRQKVTFSFSLSPFLGGVGDILFKYLSWFIHTSRHRFFFWLFQLKLIIVKEINQTSDIMKAWAWEEKKSICWLYFNHGLIIYFFALIGLFKELLFKECKLSHIFYSCSWKVSQLSVMLSSLFSPPARQVWMLGQDP